MNFFSIGAPRIFSELFVIVFQCLFQVDMGRSVSAPPDAQPTWIDYPMSPTPSGLVDESENTAVVDVSNEKVNSFID